LEKDWDWEELSKNPMSSF